MGINAIASVGISLVTVGKKDLTNQNVWTESQWYIWPDYLQLSESELSWNLTYFLDF